MHWFLFFFHGNKLLIFVLFFLLFFQQVLTFLIDPSRFRYPERAIVFLAICYLVVGCAYVAGLGAGDSASCREPFPPPIRLGKLPMYSTITMVSINDNIQIKLLQTTSKVVFCFIMSFICLFLLLSNEANKGMEMLYILGKNRKNNFRDFNFE